MILYCKYCLEPVEGEVLNEVRCGKCGGETFQADLPSDPTIPFVLTDVDKLLLIYYRIDHKDS